MNDELWDDEWREVELADFLDEENLKELINEMGLGNLTLCFPPFVLFIPLIILHIIYICKVYTLNQLVLHVSLLYIISIYIIILIT